MDEAINRQLAVTCDNANGHLILGWVNMLYHEWAGAFQAGQARGGVHHEESRYWPGLSIFPFAVFPLFPGATYN